jgi:hypothetical protein
MRGARTICFSFSLPYLALVEPVSLAAVRALSAHLRLCISPLAPRISLPDRLGFVRTTRSARAAAPLPALLLSGMIA